MTAIWKFVSVTFLIFTFSTASDACVNQEGKLVDSENVVLKLAHVIKEQFANKSIAEDVAATLMADVEAGKYKHIQQAKILETKLTEDLKRLSGDNHIGMVCDPVAVKRYQARAQSSHSESAKVNDEKNRANQLQESRIENFGIKKVELKNGYIGFLEMHYFDGHLEESKEVFAGAMNLLSGAKVIIIDLRRNGGGNSKILPLFLSYFLGPEPVHFATQYTRWKDEEKKLYTIGNVQGARHFDKPIYILTSGTTFSLAEHVTYHLRTFRRATIIGERTYGGGRAFDPVVIDDQFYVRMPRIEIINAADNSMYKEGLGIQPDILTTAENAPAVAYLHAINHLLENETRPQEKSDLQWLRRTVSIENDSPIKNSLPKLVGKKHFGEFTFEIRQNKWLWMSFRGLPWVRLNNLGDGYFYDDRSIQRQFTFSKEKGRWKVDLHQLGEPTKEIYEQSRKVVSGKSNL